VYSYEPTPEILSETEAKYILGAQGNVWTEYMTTAEQVEYMVLPRMSALSEVVWSSKEIRNWEDFQYRLLFLAKRFDAMGYHYAKHSIKMD
jgi:hexosaminidase